jgi:hypothetical protein
MLLGPAVVGSRQHGVSQGTASSRGSYIGGKAVQGKLITYGLATNEQDAYFALECVHMAGRHCLCNATPVMSCGCGGAGGEATTQAAKRFTYVM